ncbi:MAG: hypothetical protein KA187_09100 [Arenimonas sp.]|nr:hypothetical protein [Arenimonas sp.]
MTAAAGAGLVLPAFQLRGLLFELDAEGRLLRHLPFRADPNLRLIAGLASAARLHDPIARSDSDAASDPNNDRDDAAPYDVDGMSIDTAPGDAFDTGWFDADGPQAGLLADGAGADVPGADNDGPGDGDRGGQ